MAPRLSAISRVSLTLTPTPYAGLLSTKFPKDPFVVQHRSDTGYLAAQERAPVLDLSDLKKIQNIKLTFAFVGSDPDTSPN